MFVLPPFHSPIGCFPAYGSESAKVLAKTMFPMYDADYASPGWIGPFTIERFTRLQNFIIQGLNKSIESHQEEINRKKESIERINNSIDFAEMNFSHFLGETFDA